MNRLLTSVMVLGCILGAVRSIAAEAFDPASLAAPGNLVSNGSFERDEPKTGLPDGWSFYANPKFESLTEAKALHGKRSILVDRPVLEGIVHVAADQWIPIEQGHPYTLSAWVNVERCNGGSVRIYLDYYDARKSRIKAVWAECKTKTDGWKKLIVTEKAPTGTHWARLLVPYVDGDTRAFTDCVTVTSPTGRLRAPAAADHVGSVRADRVGCNFVHLEWSSDAPKHEVDVRKAGTGDWQTERNVWSTFHSVIMLEPKTAYEFRVRAIRPERYDAEGKVTSGGAGPWTQPIRVTTTPVEPKTWQGLELSPTWHIPTFPSDTAYPCIESHDGHFYIVECWGGGLHLSKVRPDDFSVVWKKEFVPKVKEIPTYQGIPDTCILGDKLYLMWNRQATGDPNYVIMDSRQWFKTYDLKTGQIGPETVIESTKPACGTWEGGLDVCQGKLWMMWLEVWLDANKRRRTRVVMRPYENGAFGAAVVFDNCPSAYPYGPSISPFGDKLILLWSDLEANEKNSDHEPIYYTLFDGKRFGKSVKFNDKVRSRYAKGAQLGDAFYCVYKCSSQYPNTGYMYHDLALTRIGRDGKIDTIYWVDDVKYNSSPDMCRVGETLYAVYGKFEHLYGKREDPARNHGAFWGKITR
ncbi:MAG: carbohydrate binding domain-containing protein [Phycisphaerae bacterium]|nr:carbohydrate binding domain-containing protein [Phycisphaerae bacterium]